jgi:hypothetical protein
MKIIKILGSAVVDDKAIVSNVALSKLAASAADVRDMIICDGALDAAVYDEAAKTVTVSLCGADFGKTDIYTVDETHSYEITDTQKGNTVTLTMQPNSFCVLKSGF